MGMSRWLNEPILLQLADDEIVTILEKSNRIFALPETSDSAGTPMIPFMVLDNDEEEPYLVCLTVAAWEKNLTEKLINKTTFATKARKEKS